MSRIETLKKQFPHLDISLLDVLSELDGTKSHKYLQLLCKVLSNSHNFEMKNTVDRNSYVSEIDEKLSSFNIDIKEPINLKYIKFRIIEHFYNPSDLNTFVQFKEFNERGLIPNSDLTKYSTISDLMGAVSLCEIRQVEKELENEIIKEFEDDKWLIVRPLSFQSSSKYGAATKWCTTYKREKNYFFKYFYKGTLVYFINKESGYKVALYGDCSHEKLVDISFWNQQDVRCDFFEVELDDYLLPVIKRIISINKPNSSYISSEKLYKLAVECDSLFRLIDDENKLYVNPNIESLEPISEPPSRIEINFEVERHPQNFLFQGMMGREEIPEMTVVPNMRA